MGPPLRLKRTALITRTVPLIRHGLRPCHLPLKGKARVRITPPTQSPTEWVCVGEEEQGSERSFRRQAETEASGLCDDEAAAKDEERCVG